MKTLISKKEAISSFVYLMEMWGQALLDIGFKKGQIHEHLLGGDGWSGFYFGGESDWGPYWCGIDFENPNNVYFYAYKLDDSAINLAQSEGWELVEEGKKRNKACRNAFPLTDDFFHRPALEQRKHLKDFIERRNTGVAVFPSI